MKYAWITEHRGLFPVAAMCGAHAQVMSAADVERATKRMAHEILERNKGLEGVILVGLQTGGVPIADRIADALEQIEGARPPVGMVDVALHRDDIGLRPVLPQAPSHIPEDVNGAIVVIVDDVLFAPADCMGAHAVRPTPDGTKLLVVCEGDHIDAGSLVVLDATTLEVETVVELGVFPDDIAILEAAP